MGLTITVQEPVEAPTDAVKEAPKAVLPAAHEATTEQNMQAMSAAVDDMAVMAEKLSALASRHKDLKKRYDEERGEFLDRFDEEFDLAEAKSIPGEMFDAKVGPGEERLILIGSDDEDFDHGAMMKEVHKQLELVAQGLFWEVCSVTIGNLEKYLTPDVLEALIKKKRNRKRKINFYPRPNP